MSRFCLIAALVSVCSSLCRAQTQVVPLWPEGKMPGHGASQPEAAVPRGDGFLRLTNVSRPTLELFPATRESGAPVPAMIICPGGGYNYVVMDKEGSSIAAWLNSRGIAALLLKYRTPQNREGALQDLQRSLSLSRARAADWNVDPQRLGVIGFSAGGHLAARAGASFRERSYPAVDEADLFPCLPNLVVLVYPAYLIDKNSEVSPELNMKAAIPPTLMIHSEDDKPHVDGTKIYRTALQRAGREHHCLLYATGGHGYGLHSAGEAKAWPRAAEQWISERWGEQ